MKIRFLCPRWGAEQIAWGPFLKEVKKAGYAGIEWFPFGEVCDPQEVLALLEETDLDFSIVMQVVTAHQDVETYQAALKADLLQLAGLRTSKKRPLFISAQCGREYFTTGQILDCLAVCEAVTRETGTAVYQETHRNKWSYAAHTVFPLLQKKPDLQLTLDVSHWFCVSESYLEDQQEAVHAAIRQTAHLHARVGHTEGPQVFDPSLPEYAMALNEHLKIWDQWLACREQQGFTESTITPEFGPPPYLTGANRNIDLQQEQWRLNLWMKDLLNERYQKTDA
ncbi:sugar phosphate isomerase/epimerase [Niabella aurantiaca]|uniref:sugar phosphate isomerase/epimerase n=1 Tax=Niabella aurantiaca TaxID=379900 RepID=UPI000399E123|nr:sugar phosphate isomerase/epimerase [Niabella aurantiaca]